MNDDRATDDERVDAAGAARVWVRRCAACGRHDLTAAFGRRDMVEGAWSCPTCSATAHVAEHVAMPDGTPRAACPYLGAA